ncbi:6-phosphogluconolactonase [Novipirellula artificiosorum]|uniref:6-phosphogluconolactonase n=1 Tax=Novipirellula artificiosorum TaxID=2528016 RepID=A0A5C6DUM6_9BACT|nr:6-phosphogluconolactonase [Novipirellula artificiosorum]TWU41063.1 6-phosphogluconolactonase [Novipirellula artificiosorum]
MSDETIQPYRSLAELHQAAADAFCECAEQSLASRGVFRVALSGGSTPKRLYEMLAERSLNWERIHWFLGDERNVPLDSLDSNYRMICETLLEPARAPDENIHPVFVDLQNPAAAAETYEKTLRTHFPDQTMPAWDLVLLGMGDDSHTASLFPGTAALDETERWFVANWVEKLACFRYTLTAPAINSAKERWFLVAGKNKKQAIASVLRGERSPSHHPSQMIETTRMFVTEDAWTSNE